MALLVRYVESATDLADLVRTGAPLSPESWEIFGRINRSILMLEPRGDLGRHLRSKMLEDWDTVSEYRNKLQAATDHRAPTFYWLVLVSGFLAVVVPCCVYAPTRPTLVGLGLFGAYNGIVMYIIFVIANPFVGSAAVESTRWGGRLLAIMKGAGD